jgi:MFS family permease
MASYTETVELQSIPAAAPLTHLKKSNWNSTSEQLATPPTQSSRRQLKKWQIVLLVSQLSGLNLLSSMTNGFIIVGLPTISVELNLPQALSLWPSAVYGLTCGSTLLLAGSVADIIGCRRVELAGCLILSILTLGTGFVQDGVQLVVLRALQGVALSLHLPSSVSIVSSSLPKGRVRNVSFSCLGLSQVLGFSIGLVLGGILIDTIGWRSGWYICGGLGFILTAVGFWVLPMDKNKTIGYKALLSDVDWTGTLLVSASLALLSYLLA